MTHLKVSHHTKPIDIYNQYGTLVYNLTLSYLNNIEDAEEVTQDVFVAVFQSINQFNEKSLFKTWVYRIAVNKCLDFLRAKTRKKRWANIVGIFGDNGTLTHNPPDFAHPGVLLENQENAAYLFKAINELPESQKTAFLLSHTENLNNKEIAAVMDKTVSAIESLIQRAKQNLQKTLANFYTEYRQK